MNQGYVITQRIIYVLTESGYSEPRLSDYSENYFVLTESGYSEPRLSDYSGNYFCFDRVRL